MTTKRRAAEEPGDEHPSKRHQFKEENKILITPSSLDDMNDDCVLNILQHLPAEDLNSVAICSRRYREARSHESLDQTRTGTIVCTENTTFNSIVDAFNVQGWNRVFTGNRTHLKAVGLERQPRFPYPFEISHYRLLPNVSSLDMSLDALAPYQEVTQAMLAFVRMLPNLEEIDLSCLRTPPETTWFLLNGISSRTLRRVSWKGSQQQVDLTGNPFKAFFTALTELHLDSSEFKAACRPTLFEVEQDIDAAQEQDGPNRFLFHVCPHLERLSIKNVTFRHFNGPSEQVSQGMLIKMVRHHHTLRWLRSDLTEENIAMLQQEKPEITFVSD